MTSAAEISSTYRMIISVKSLDSIRATQFIKPMKFFGNGLQLRAGTGTYGAKFTRLNSSKVRCRSGLTEFFEEIAPQRRVQSDSVPQAVRNATIRAVEGVGRRATAGDVAARAGVKLSDAEKTLNALATDVGGYLEVSDDGDILYVFPGDIQASLVQKSLLLKIEPYVKGLQNVGQYFVRVAFGTALLTSIALTYTAIFVVMTSSRSENERDDRRSFRPAFYMNPLDFLWYMDPRYSLGSRRARDSTELNFFESIFSFVFGDGDPNEEVESIRWKLVGEYIGQRGGVVTAEELAPFLDPPKLEPSQPLSIRDESYVIPVLQRLDGHPEVDEQGQILYKFPSLQRTAVERRGRAGLQSALDGQSLEEYKWSFSQASSEQRVMVVALGLFNVVGVTFLGSLLRDPALVRQVGSSVVSLASTLMPLLQAYAYSFFAIPVVRWLLWTRRNEKIEERNENRRVWSRFVTSRDPQLLRKRASARKLAESTVIGRDRVVYSTNRDIADQGLEAAEFDRRLRERS